jgi:hypothetical protein
MHPPRLGGNLDLLCLEWPPEITMGCFFIVGFVDVANERR